MLLNRTFLGGGQLALYWPDMNLGLQSALPVIPSTKYECDYLIESTSPRNRKAVSSAAPVTSQKP